MQLFMFVHSVSTFHITTSTLMLTLNRGSNIRPSLAGEISGGEHVDDRQSLQLKDLLASFIREDRSRNQFSRP